MGSRKCPCCGGQLEIIDEAFGTVKCPYCDYTGTEDDYRVTHHSIFTDTAKLEEAKTERYKVERMLDRLEKQDAAKEVEKKKRTKYIISFLVLIVPLICGILLVYQISHKDDIHIGTSSSELIGRSVATVARVISDAGFTNIDIVEIKDLTNKDASLEYQVTKIYINGKSNFSIQTWFPRDSRVVVEYHLLDPDRPDDKPLPGRSESFIGRDYKDVKKAFEEAGFTNINLDPRGDVSALSKERWLVTEIYVDGRNSFTTDTWVEKTAKVTITFHCTKGDAKDVSKAQEEKDYIQANEGNIRMPQAAKKYLGINYLEVEKAVRALGFENINLIPLEDLKKDILRQENKVDEISINGNTQFKENAYFEPDALVVIKYHSKDKKAK